MNNYSKISLKGHVSVTAINEATGEIVQRAEADNTIVRDGRVAIAKLVTGIASYDYAYIILDTTFPKTYQPSPDVSHNWLGISINGHNNLYYVGPLYSSNATANASLGPVTRDANGFATYLNQLFATYDNIGDFPALVPVYDVNRDPAAYVPTYSPIRASVVSIGGVDRVKIQHRSQGSANTIAQYDTNLPPGLGDAWARFYTDSTLYGPLTVYHASADQGSNTSSYTVDGVRLGVSNGITNVTDYEFVPGTYTSLRYTPTITYGQSDTQHFYDTQAIFEIVIPAVESNGETGLGVLFTEAALLCKNEQWFAHVNFGQVYKTNQIRLLVRWTIDFLPQ